MRPRGEYKNTAIRKYIKLFTYATRAVLCACSGLPQFRNSQALTVKERHDGGERQDQVAGADEARRGRGDIVGGC